MSKHMCEMILKGCGMNGTPDVPCYDDITSCEINLIGSDDREFPTFPETTSSAMLRLVIQLLWSGCHNNACYRKS